MTVKTRLVSSLEKIFCDADLPADAHVSGTALLGERFSFQLCCRLADAPSMRISLQVDAPLADCITLYTVGHVPSLLPAYPEADDDYLRTAPGLFPDVLEPAVFPVTIGHAATTVFWVETAIPPTASGGDCPIRLTLTGEQGQLLATEVFRLTVIPARLPEQTLLYTDWLHVDCLASYYRVPVFSERHWALLDAYLENAARYGVNLLLTPVLTPPLDTAVGSERPTVQLTDITVTAAGYRFGFDRLERYLALAEKHGIRHFEISHLFTQWGAAHAPKVMAAVNGVQQPIFGWKTDATGEEYRAFLTAFLGALKAFLTQRGCLSSCFFHLSDEPSAEALPTYRAARAGVATALAGCRTMDALSLFDFYEQGLTDVPVVATDALEPFLAHKVPGLWAYYCCGQTVTVSNRLFAMSSVRNRILGWQLYKYQMAGFLHWGYNFWYSALSRRAIDPYRVTDADRTFPSGDAFVVYPGENGPVPSLRQLVFFEGLQDLRALQLLERYLPHAEIVRRLETIAGGTLTFRDYPRTAAAVLALREEINRLLREQTEA